MLTEKQVLEKYEQADMRMRLSMYLEYRDNRNKFMLIDMKENKNRKEAAAMCFNKHQKMERRWHPSQWRKFLIHVFAYR